MRTINDERPEPEPSQPYEVQAVEQETELAILVVMHEDGDMRWIPKSVIHSTSVVQGMGDSGPLVVQEWWLRTHGDDWGASAQPATSGKQGTGKAIGVSDLAAVQKLLVSKGITRIDFMPKNPHHCVRIESDEGGMTGKDLSQVVRALDRARRE